MRIEKARRASIRLLYCKAGRNGINCKDVSRTQTSLCWLSSIAHNTQQQTTVTMNITRKRPSDEAAFDHESSSSSSVLYGNAIKRYRSSHHSDRQQHHSSTSSLPVVRHPFFDEAIFQQQLMYLATSVGSNPFVQQDHHSQYNHRQSAAQSSHEGFKFKTVTQQIQQQLRHHEDHHLNLLADVVAGDDHHHDDDEAHGDDDEHKEERKATAQEDTDFTKAWEEAVKNDKVDVDVDDDNSNNSNNIPRTSCKKKKKGTPASTSSLSANDPFVKFCLPPGIPLQAPPSIPMSLRPGQTVVTTSSLSSLL